MILRPGIVLFVAACSAGGEIVSGEKSHMPPNNHQDSHVLQGPNMKSLSFARNGAATTTIVTNLLMNKTS